MKTSHGHVTFFFNADLVLPKMMQFSCPVGKHNEHMLMEKYTRCLIR